MAFIPGKTARGIRGESGDEQERKYVQRKKNGVTGTTTRRHCVSISTIPLASITTLSSSCPTSSCSSSLLIRHDKKTLSFTEATRKRGSGSLLWWWACILLSAAILLSSSTCGQAEAKHAWERPGCHKVGHTRKVQIPECVEFTITTNACRGYCESFAVPSAWYRLQNNPSQAITSVGQCCNIMETEDVTVNVMCMDGQKELVFKSAKSCACYHCKKD